MFPSFWHHRIILTTEFALKHVKCVTQWVQHKAQDLLTMPICSRCSFWSAFSFLYCALYTVVCLFCPLLSTYESGYHFKFKAFFMIRLKITEINSIFCNIPTSSIRNQVSRMFFFSANTIWLYYTFQSLISVGSIEILWSLIPEILYCYYCLESVVYMYRLDPILGHILKS